MDLLAALALWMGGADLRQESPLHFDAPKGTIENIPLVVLSEESWGAL